MNPETCRYNILPKKDRESEMESNRYRENKVERVLFPVAGYGVFHLSRQRGGLPLCGAYNLKTHKKFVGKEIPEKYCRRCDRVIKSEKNRIQKKRRKK